MAARDAPPDLGEEGFEVGDQPGLPVLANSKSSPVRRRGPGQGRF